MEDNSHIKQFLGFINKNKEQKKQTEITTERKKTEFKERKNLPKSKEEFKNELNKATDLKQSDRFQKTLDDINKFMTNEDNNMFSNGEARKENWYELITCDEHLRLNYEILKQYAHYLARFSAERLIRKEDQFKIKSNLRFLKQIREICDLTFIGVMQKKAKNKKEEDYQKKQEENHQFFMDLIEKSINELSI